MGFLQDDPLLSRVQEILFREWDPIGVADNVECRDEYDSYAMTLVRLLRSGADEYKIALRLGTFQRVTMGLSRVDEAVDRRVASRLVALASEFRARD